MTLATTVAQVRVAIAQEQTAREKLIFALLHPATGQGHHSVGHPVGQHLAELHKLVMAPEIRDKSSLGGDTAAGRRLFKDAMRVGTMGDVLVMPTSNEELQGDHGRWDPSTHLIHLEHPENAFSPDDHTRTLVHELAHSYITRANNGEWLQRSAGSAANSGRDVDEVVAEGATYIVAKHYGLDTSEKSLGHIHYYAGPGHDVFHDPTTLGLIRDTANAMLKDLDPIAKPTLPKVTAEPYVETSVKHEGTTIVAPYVRAAYKRIEHEFGTTSDSEFEAAMRALSGEGLATPMLADIKPIRIEMRRKNAEILSARTGGELSVDDAYQFQQQWSASPDATISMILQREVSDQFGLAPTGKWSSLSRGILEDSGVSFDFGSLATSTTREQWEEAARLFIGAQYAETQDYYKKLGITHVTVHRGIAFEQVDQIPGPLKRGHETRGKKRAQAIADLQPGHPPGPGIRRLGTAKNVKMHPLSSFALDHEAAVNFTSGDYGVSYLVSASVPVERIFGNGITGIGAATESEHVIIGGPTDLAFEEFWNL